MIQQHTDPSMALVPGNQLNTAQKISLAIGFLGLFIILLAWFSGYNFMPPTLALPLALAGIAVGVTGYAWATYRSLPEGIKNNRVMMRSLSNRGVWGYMVALLLSGFYICLYWYPEYFGLAQDGRHTGLIALFEPLSQLVRARPADQWFVYGTLYTVGVLVMGVKFILKYRHNRYQIIRTLSVMFFQLIFAYLIPAWMLMMNQPEFYFTYFWPLKYSALFPNDINGLMSGGNLGVFLVFWGVVMSFVAVPVLTYFYGKRWYCSWVCGCGALAETTGDPFRTLSDKSMRAWKIERWLIHSVLIFIILTTVLLWINSMYQGAVLGSWSAGMAKAYSFLIGSTFAGVIGTGFYPILGNRGWCRFGCPQAAILGIFQKYFSRFRITTNGGQCISCGNCSTHCEMGIDVKAYAQRGQDIVRASCVGCGVCSAVCPRGVLRLENGSIDILERAKAVRNQA
jgi:ferredoxin-type protein NapH